MDLTCFPRVRLAYLPTPLESLKRLSAVLGGPEIWIKRRGISGRASTSYFCTLEALLTCLAITVSLTL